MTDRSPTARPPATPLTGLTRVCGAVLLLAAIVAPAEAVLPTGFSDELMATGLSTPVGLAFLPDGRLLCTEQFSGNVELLPVGGASTTTIFTVPDVLGGSERGLLGVVADPDWPARPYLYFNFSVSGNDIYVRMYTVSGDLTDPASTNLTLSNPYNILTDIPDNAFNHNGGTLRFGPDGMLYVSSGDDAALCNAQVLSSLSGKILRLDVSALPLAGSGPPAKSVITPVDNPFPGPNENEKLLYCHGLRNPFRFSIDPVTGRLYIGDVGPATYEEIDEANGGDNFGWPKREGNHDYPPGAGCTGSNGESPIYEYDRSGQSASVIGGPRYRAGGSLSFPPEYDGDVFLLEYYQGWIRRLTYNSQNLRWELAPAVPGQPSATNWATGYSGVPELIVGPDGAIYYVTQFGTGMIRRIGNPTGVGVEPIASAAATNALTVSPNPWRASGDLTVSYSIARPGAVRISIHDVSGARVRTIVDGPQGLGSRTVSWDGRGQDGSMLTSGVYFVRLEAEGEILRTRKVTLTR